MHSCPLVQSIGKLLWVSAAALFIYMTIGWLVAWRRNKFDTVDAAWGLGFVIVAWLAVAHHSTHQALLIATLVTIWGIRITYHLGRRSFTRKEDDRRYLELAEKWKGNRWRRAYFSVFLVQGLIIWIITLPVMLSAGVKLHSWGWLTYVGTAVWVVGFCIETLADRQLAQYVAMSKRPKVLDSGLWKYSRHPNYFGELSQWWGIGIIALQMSYGRIGLLGPLVLTGLILFVSGIPPIEQRRQKDAAYRAYMKHTSVLVPLPKRQTKAA